MRVLLAVVVLTGVAFCASAQEPTVGAVADDPQTIVWTKVFSPISAVDADNTLVFVVATNDDPAITDALFEDRQRAIDPDLWCAAELARSFRMAEEVRPDLRSRVSFQPLPAGMPKSLTGGSLRNQAARAIVAVCDGNYRLLGLTVGVPDTDGLLDLIEDAEEVRLLSQLHRQARRSLIAALAQRSGERLSRVWHAALEEMIVAMGDARLDDNTDVPSASDQQQIDRFLALSEAYQPHYLADVRLRFGLREAADRNRLVILEQHAQTRRPWVDAMIPFLAGEDWLTLWNPVCESLWGLQPITADAEDPELLQWWDSQAELGTVVLSLQPPRLARRPVVSNETARRGIGWNDVQDLVEQFPYRAVDAQQLAMLIAARKLKPVDIELPTTARYLLFESKKKAALVFRDGDPPGRLFGRLNRAK